MDAPELTTFGSVVRHALELEAATAALYEAAAKLLRPQDTAAALRELGVQHANRHQLLEHTRQRTLNEMVLEPISGLEGERYIFDASLKAPAEIGPTATLLEEVGYRFYRECAVVAQSLPAEAVRSFRRLAQENEDNLARLRRILPA